MAKQWDVCVLGAGVVGVATAYELARAGRSVLVLDRLAGPGLDTSFANGGQASFSHIEPWASPTAPLQVIKWLAHGDAPLLFRPRFDPWQWLWLGAWLIECLPPRARANALAELALANRSRAAFARLRSEEILPYHQQMVGLIGVHRSQAEHDAAAARAEALRVHGLPIEILDRAAVLAREPALARIAHEIAGGDFTPQDETGDAHLFTKALATAAEKRGAELRFGLEAVGFDHDRSARRIDGLRVRDLTSGEYGRIEAGQYVLALGSFSAELARPLGLYLNIYPAKGYSLTLDIANPDGAPRVSVTDETEKVVFTRLGNRLRVAGTAELSGYSRDINLRRVQAMRDLSRRFFPSAGDWDAARPWTGLRPATPSNRPYIGPTRYRNLFLNTGHGTLGFTLAPGSAELVAAAVLAAG
jgi:D-amino-acid dehydrogenase